VVWVVLVVLGLINIGFIIFSIRQFNKYEKYLIKHIENINLTLTEFLTYRDSVYEKVFELFEKQSNQIKQIPKEITVKNVLNIP
jgi:hypothetical protein